MTFKIGEPPSAINPTPVSLSNDNIAALAPEPAKRERIQLVAANTPRPAVTLYGGDYIFSWMADTYGSIALKVLGPDGKSWLTAFTKTAADAGTGVGLVLAAGAIVRVELTSTTAANVTLARIPA